MTLSSTSSARFTILSYCLCLVFFFLSACGGSSSRSAADASPSGDNGTTNHGTDSPTDEQTEDNGTTNHGSDSPTDEQPEERRAFPYVVDGPYADVLWECLASWAFQPCSFEKLPLIGQETDKPEVEDILDRLLVSHDWIGDNFRTVLERLPSDALLLFRSTTGIVISDDFPRNVFFLGTVRFDPIFFWLTPAQREELPQATRGTQASDGLSFRMPWRYVRDGVPLSFLGPDTGSRAEEDMVYAAAAVLYHELAHAADWMPPTEFPNVGKPEDAPEVRLAEAWQESFPIRSGFQSTDLRLYELAQVRFGVAEATSALRDVQPAELVAPFAEEGAMRFYSYVDAAEDFATAYEAAMMAFHFGYHQETAITENVAQSAGDEIVIWGQRGRLGEQHVYARAQGAVQAIYPGDLSAVESFLASQPPATQMRTGITWRESAGSTE